MGVSFSGERHILGGGGGNVAAGGRVMVYCKKGDDCKMKKKLFSIILVLCMAVSCAGFAAAEDAAAPGPLTSEELTTWAGELKDAALGTATANDPAAE